MIKLDIPNVLTRIHKVIPRRVRRAASPLQPIYYGLVSLGGERVIETPWGAKMHVNPDNQIEWRFATGTFEEHLVKKITREFSGEKLHVADVGANIGYYSLLFDSVLDGGFIDAFEPLPPVIKLLKRNIILNEDTNITVHPYAVMDSTDNIDLTLPDDGNIGMATVANQSGDKFTVSSKPLDEIYAQGSIPDVVKVDIEGAELDLVRGGEHTLNEIDVLILEMHPQYVSQLEISQLFKRLSAARFTETTIVETGERFDIESPDLSDIISEQCHIWIT